MARRARHFFGLTGAPRESSIESRIEEEANMIFVSACRLGVRCRFDGKACKDENLIRWLKGKRFLAVCPEQLGGLGTPREPSSFKGGSGKEVLQGKARLSNARGEDVTAAFLRGAREVARLARLFEARLWIGKEKSPACAVKEVYVNGKICKGEGVTTALLLKEGLRVCEEVKRKRRLQNG